MFNTRESKIRELQRLSVILAHIRDTRSSNTQPAIEAFAEGVLLRLAGLDVLPADAAFVGLVPAQVDLLLDEGAAVGCVYVCSERSFGSGMLGEENLANTRSGGSGRWPSRCSR